MIKPSTVHECDIKTIHLNCAEITCKKDEHGHPCVLCNKQKHQTIHTELYSLTEEIPELYEEKQIVNLATLVNFLLRGEEFQLITNPTQYRKEYQEQIEKEQNSFDLPMNPLIGYGIFDLEEISLPTIKRGKGSDCDCLVFYVGKRKVPYKVTCPIPIRDTQLICKYEILKKYK